MVPFDQVCNLLFFFLAVNVLLKFVVFSHVGLFKKHNREATTTSLTSDLGCMTNQNVTGKDSIPPVLFS